MINTNSFFSKMKNINGFILIIREKSIKESEGKIINFVIELGDIPPYLDEFSYIENLCRNLNYIFDNLIIKYDVYSRIYSPNLSDVGNQIKSQLQ